MASVVHVLQLSDSFEQIWESLAASAGAQAQLHSGPALPSGVPQGCATVIAAGGVEAESLALLAELPVTPHQPPVVVGSATDHRLAISLVKRGADNYFALPDELGGLRAWLAARVEAATERERLERSAAEWKRSFDFSRLIGRSQGLRTSLQRAARVIPRGSATVLITGETGTGKELLARAIHYNGPRRGQPFVEINCAALPPNLLEAELFGYERGAFTDAKAAKPGLYEAADGGTLLLDEIGELNLELQAKLLRVLETRRVRRIGSVRDQAVDVRIIAATHVDLAAAVRAGSFRADLYYRLGVVPIHLPALRERGDDVLLLAEHFLDRLSEQYELARPRLTPEVERALLRYAWPGNVRELKNALERAVVLSDGELRVEDLFLEPAPPAGDGGIPFPASIAEMTAVAARRMVELCGGNKSEAAKALGISRRHLYVLLARAADADGEPEPGAAP